MIDSKYFDITLLCTSKIRNTALHISEKISHEMKYYIPTHQLKPQRIFGFQYQLLSHSHFQFDDVVPCPTPLESDDFRRLNYHVVHCNRLEISLVAAVVGFVVYSDLCIRFRSTEQFNLFGPHGSRIENFRGNYQFLHHMFSMALFTHSITVDGVLDER